MKTNNEKWHGNANSGAGRDGKPFEKRDVKSILKGSRGAAKFTTTRPSAERVTGSSDYERKNDERPQQGEKRSFESRGYSERKSFDNNNRGGYGERRSFDNNNGERRSFDNNGGYGERRSFDNNREGRSNYGERNSYPNRGERSGNGEQRFSSPRKPWENRGEKPAYGERRPYQSKPWEDRNGNNGERSYNNNNGERQYGRPRFNSNGNDSRNQESRPARLSFRKPGEDSQTEYIETRFESKREGVVFRKPRKRTDDYDPNAKYSHKKQSEFNRNNVDLTKPVRLNKFLANAGICSRREADEYIQAGVISVNGEIVTEMGVKVLLTDKILFHDQQVRSERKVYILLNKPKDCVTTAEDTHERLTVLDLVKNACSERIYPVGRLDRNTTGVLLLTNDGDLASKLTHPKYDKKKIYHATLDKPLERDDFETILQGVQLDDDKIAADSLEFVKEADFKQVGIEIHSGQNRVVRRIFEKLGYKVIRLDRVFYAGLTKKNLPRGKYRFLNDREIGMLKMGAHE